MNRDLALLTERIEALENYNRWVAALNMFSWGLLTYLFMKIEGLL